VPLGYSLTSSASVTTIPTLVAAGDVNELQIRAFGSGPYTGPKSLTFARQGTVAVTPGQPVTWSILARLDYPSRSASDIPTSVVKIDTLRLTVSFRDALDAELSAQVVVFDPAVITGDALALVENAVPVPPVGTNGVRVSLQLESIEASDDVTLHLMAPQIEQSASATSRMVGAGSVSRSADALRLPQAGNIETRAGSIQVDLATSYPGTPAADSCVVDTREAGLNGFALYHLQNGKLRFVVADASTSATLETANPYSFSAGESHSLVISWDMAHRSIWVDGVVAAESNAAYNRPSQLNEWLVLLSEADGSARLQGVLTAAEVQREQFS
jgi:hypothetical protein